MVLYIAAPPPDHKTCSKCGQCEKHSKYTRNKRDGLQSKCVQCQKVYNEERKDEIRAQQKQYREENKDKINTQKKQHYEENKDEIRAYQKKYYEENRDEIIAHQVEYNRNRRQTDDAYRLLKICRTRLRSALKGNLKTVKTLELLGCTSDELLEHLERTMSPEVRALRDEGVDLALCGLRPP